MPKFSKRSLTKLETCDYDLQRLFNEVIQYFDCTILEGYRNEAKQDEMYKFGRSKSIYPNSKHNKKPSLAVDVVPYPINWKDTDRMYYFGGFVKDIATKMNLKIRWGGDWDNDTKVHDQTFIDLPHFELVIDEKE